MKISIVPAVIALLAATSVSAVAGPCDAPGKQAECLALISEVDRAIAWLTKKQAEDPVATESALTQCNSKVPAGADISVVLNCMINILGP